MQEEANEKSINLCITSARVSLEAITAIMRTWSAHARAKSQGKLPHEVHGRQTMRALANSGAELSQVPIDKTGLHEFAKEAKKYRVDYAVVKDKSGGKTRYLIFFKAKNAAQLEQAFSAYTRRMLSKGKMQPSGDAHTKEQAKDATQDAVKQVTEVFTPGKSKTKEERTR